MLECFLCETPYTFFNRRHHCRKCGRAVCGECLAQTVKWFQNLRAIQPDGSTARVREGDSLRTCDQCVEEIRMIRLALFDGSQHSHSQNDSQNDSQHSHNQNDSQNDSQHNQNDSQVPNDLDEDNLCPVCAKDMLRGYIRSVKKAHVPWQKEEYEKYKETHINECLVLYDFDGDHRADGRMRNRMLVYNIPPIPQPRYENLPNGEPSCGLVTLATSVSHEKQDSECVICLEDLKLGDKVGRLECLCVFHYLCIKDWFNRKGYGQCPVHY